MKLNKGFTLLEVLIAMLILTIAAAGILGTFTFGKRSVNLPSSQFEALNYARQTAEELRQAVHNYYYSPPSGPLYPLVTNQANGNFSIGAVTGGRYYTVANIDLDGDPSNGAESRKVTIKVNWNEPTP